MLCDIQTFEKGPFLRCAPTLCFSKLNNPNESHTTYLLRLMLFSEVSSWDDPYQASGIDSSLEVAISVILLTFFEENLP